MTKPPDDEDDALMPGPKRQSERYNSRRPQRAWPFWEDALLWPCLLGTGTLASYCDVQTVLCDFLNRQPSYGKGENPTTLTRRRDRTALIDHRTVTDVMRSVRPNLAGFFGFVEQQYAGLRTGLPLSWAERVRFLWPYTNKLKTGQTRISVGRLLMLLERSEEDRAMVEEHLAEVQGTKEPPGRQDWTPNEHLTGHWEIEMVRLAHDYRLAVAADHLSLRRKAWRALVEFTAVPVEA